MTIDFLPGDIVLCIEGENDGKLIEGQEYTLDDIQDTDHKGRTYCHIRGYGVSNIDRFRLAFRPANRDEVVAMREALKPFAMFSNYYDAIRETDGDERLSDSSVVMQVSGAGGSFRLHVEDFRRAAEALKSETQEEVSHGS